MADNYGCNKKGKPFVNTLAVSKHISLPYLCASVFTPARMQIMHLRAQVCILIMRTGQLYLRALANLHGLGVGRVIQLLCLAPLKAKPKARRAPTSISRVHISPASASAPAREVLNPSDFRRQDKGRMQPVYTYACQNSIRKRSPDDDFMKLFADVCNVPAAPQLLAYVLEFPNPLRTI